MKKVKKNKLPVVCISALDHFSEKPCNHSQLDPTFDVVGLLYKETKEAWYLATMVFEKNLADENNEGFVFIKTLGAKIKVIGYVS